MECRQVGDEKRTVEKLHRHVKFSCVNDNWEGSGHTLVARATVDDDGQSATVHARIASCRCISLCARLDVVGVAGKVDLADNKFRMLCARLEGVNPLSVLSHGYAMVQGEDGRIISSVGDVKVGDRVEIGLRDGKILASVEEMKENLAKEEI